MSIQSVLHAQSGYGPLYARSAPFTVETTTLHASDSWSLVL
jgi:hypothetical protein